MTVPMDTIIITRFFHSCSSFLIICKLRDRKDGRILVILSSSYKVLDVKTKNSIKNKNRANYDNFNLLMKFSVRIYIIILSANNLLIGS